MTLEERVKRYREILLGLPDTPNNRAFNESMFIVTTLPSGKNESEYIIEIGNFYSIEESILLEISELLYPSV
jgi:hypothetical protein